MTFTISKDAVSGLDLPSPAPADRTTHLIAAGLAVAMLILSLFSLDFRTSGDSLVYADNIAQRKFDFVAVHYGYYVLVWALQILLTPIVSVPVDVFMVYLNAVFGSVGLYVGFWLARDLLGSTRLAVYATLVLAVSGRYFVNATAAEMYASQSLFMFASFHLFLNRWPITSALCAVVGLLISPLSLFSFAFYPVAAWLRGLSFRYLVTWSVALVVPYVVFLAIYHQALFWGERGLFAVTSIVPWEFIDGPRFFVQDLVKFFGPAVLFFALGLRAVKKHRAFAVLVIAVYLPHLYVMFKQARADMLIAPTDIFFACGCAIGLSVIDSWRVGRYVTVPVLATSLVLLAYLNLAFGGSGSRQYGESMTMMYEQVMKGSSRVVIMKWFDRISAQYYNTEPANRVWDRNPAAPHIYDEQWFDARVPRPLPAGAELYVLEDYTPSRISRLIRSEQDLQERFEQVSLRRRVERDLNLQCTPAPVGILDLYRCAARTSDR